MTRSLANAVHDCALLEYGEGESPTPHLAGWPGRQEYDYGMCVGACFAFAAGLSKNTSFCDRQHSRVPAGTANLSAKEQKGISHEERQGYRCAIGVTENGSRTVATFRNRRGLARGSVPARSILASNVAGSLPTYRSRRPRVSAWSHQALETEAGSSQLRASN